MNLPEYRRAVRRAAEAFSERLEVAQKEYRDTMLKADAEFMEDPEEAKMAEPARERIG